MNCARTARALLKKNAAASVLLSAVQIIQNANILKRKNQKYLIFHVRNAKRAKSQKNAPGAARYFMDAINIRIVNLLSGINQQERSARNADP